MIVESPTKVKTLKQFLPSNYIIMASVGHICALANTGDYNTGIDLTNGTFEEDYKVDDSKRDVVQKLKEQVKAADVIYLATDPDREGEAIAWHVFRECKIPKNKVKRITYHEITKAAVEKAIQNPRDIDFNYVDAARVRQDRDKIVGFPGSQACRYNKKGNSIGNVQCPALRLVVDREEEIENFVSETYFDFYLNFSKNNVPFKAKYQSAERLTSLDQCKAIADECKPNPYIVSNITKKDSKENPKPPFITSTFLQEVTTKLNLSADAAMSCAQELFQGVDVNHNHIALITYHRTDDATYAPEFVTELKKFITDNYGKDYCGELKAGKKSDTAQAGHEGIRVVDLTMTPDKLKEYLHNDLLIKIYTIIYKRTVASCMKPAIIANTTYEIKNGNHIFSMNSKELRFDGYKIVYSYKDEDDKDDSQIIKETFTKGEQLSNTELEAIEKHTSPPKRYNEASLMKKLEDLGIGRPSTYASTVKGIQDAKRGVAKLINKELVPTPLGITQIHWLKADLPNIVDLQARANQEKELDLIADGKIDRITAMTDWWAKFKADLERVMPSMNTSEVKTCPNCGKPMVIRKGRSLFWGCSGYPQCTTTESIKKKA